MPLPLQFPSKIAETSHKITAVTKLVFQISPATSHWEHLLNPYEVTSFWALRQPSFHFGMGHLSQVRSAFYFVGSFSHLHCWAKDCVNFQCCPLWLYIAYIANSLQKTNLENDGNTKRWPTRFLDSSPGILKELFTKQKHLSHVSQTDDLRKEVVGISRKHGRVFHVVIGPPGRKKLLVNMENHSPILQMKMNKICFQRAFNQESLLK